MNNGDRNDDRFDAVAQAVHAHALGALSPRTLAQLQARRRTVQVPPVRFLSRGYAWPMAVAGAFAALAIGWQLMRPQASAPPSPVTMISSAAEDDSATLALEENPELYEWLASRDAQTLAME